MSFISNFPLPPSRRTAAKPCLFRGDLTPFFGLILYQMMQVRACIVRGAQFIVTQVVQPTNCLCLVT